MDIVEIGLRLMGAFYVFAGIVATRAAVTSHFLDKAIAALGGKTPTRVERAITAWHVSAATLVLVGGVALAARLDVAPFLFVASAIGQAAYIAVVGPLWFDVEDPPDPKGRQQTTNAFFLYCAATALVIWASMTGNLSPTVEAGSVVLGIAAAVVVAHVFQTARYFATPISSPFANTATEDRPASDDASSMPLREAHESRAVKVMAEYESHPLWALDDDTYGDFSPEKLGLSEKLTRDLAAWGEAFSTSLNSDDPANSHWTEARYLEHAEQARPLAARLARERPDLTVYVVEQPAGLVQVRADDS
jgi:hypothetical protein